jgi:hypothetical protein
MKEVSFVLLGMMMSFVFMGGASAYSVVYDFSPDAYDEVNIYNYNGGTTILSDGWINGSCVYPYTGHAEASFYDNSLGTCHCEGGTSTNSSVISYFNWTKQFSSMSSSFISVYYPMMQAPDMYNLTIPSSCWNYNPTELYFRYSSDSAGGVQHLRCWNGTWADTVETFYTNSVCGFAMWWNVSTTTSGECNASTKGFTACGGYNAQSVLTCGVFDGYYDWFSNRTYCPYGCYQGSCLPDTTPCVNYCSAGSTMCDGYDVINCTDVNGDGCYDWGSASIEHCQWGCFSGSCFYPRDVCSYGDFKCVNGNVYNCSNGSVTGTYSYGLLQTCSFGCGYVYQPDGSFNASCVEVNDAHLTSSSMRVAVNQVSFIFGPLSFAVYMFICIFISGLVAWKADAPGISIWIFGLFMLSGTIIGIVPIYASLILIVLVVGFKAYGGLHGNK